ncbi:MAG: arylsulfatase, partial [Bacteroidaceae bacterium]|nr:arylsulfatase [Bacteroidaceae bacterium]
APTFLGHPEAQRQHDHLYWEFHETDMIGLRQGDWKLVVRRGTPALYNLASDPHEDHDLSKSHPDLLRQLIKKVHADHTDHPLFPVTLPTLVP